MDADLIPPILFLLNLVLFGFYVSSLFTFKAFTGLGKYSLYVRSYIRLRGRCLFTVAFSFCLLFEGSMLHVRYKIGVWKLSTERVMDVLD
jgi:hypothetical protein